MTTIESKKNFPLRLALYNYDEDKIYGITVELEIAFSAIYSDEKPSMLDFMQIASNFLISKYNEKLLIKKPNEYILASTKNTVETTFDPSVENLLNNILFVELPLLFKFSTCIITSITAYENKIKLLDVHV